jgi:phenylacetyl-CoA:acceptor oxidoreductase subunit 2
MKPKRNVLPGQPGPRLQQHWDWRAAANFICGGSGGGLVFFAALAGLAGVDVRAQMAAGLALAAAGLLCVWLEIGRPWRALNVFRHLRTSWMTREAAVALLLFGSGTLAVASSHPAAQALAGLCGLAFVYSQARILTADKGIPAWRHARCAPLMLLTGVAEGAGLIAATLPGELHAVAGMVIALAVLARLLLWRRYLDGLRESAAPVASLRALAAIERRFAVFGSIVPASLALLATAGALVGIAGTAIVLAVAGVLTTAAGGLCKYTLIRRAAFTQGIALAHHPVRGGRRPAPPAAPGLSKA